MLVLDPCPNVALLDAVEQKILNDRDSWNQQQWNSGTPDENMCSTSFCVAGHAAVMSGAALPKYWFDEWTVDPATGESFGVWNSDRVMVSQYAQAKLGLTDGERLDLFYGLNTLNEVQKIMHGIRSRWWAIQVYEGFMAEQALTEAAEVMADVAFLDAEASQEVPA